ncbi:MAG: ATP-binding protein [Bryobacterales bacterium]
MIPSLRRIAFGVREDAFRAVLETIPDAVALVDDRGRIAAINQAAESIFGREEADLIGRPVEALIPARFHGKHPRLVQEYFAQPQVAYGPDRFRHGEELQLFGRRANDEEFPVEISVGPLETPEGVFALTVIRDITQKKRLQARLKDYNRTLEREVRERTAELQAKQAELIQSAKMAALGNLAAGVVHEMNTPLGALRSANQTALAVARRLLAVEKGESSGSTRSPAEMAKVLEELTAASEQAIADLTRVVASLRIFARIDSFDDSEEDLVEGLRSVLTLLEPRTRGRIRLEGELQPLPPIRGKHRDLNQALMNVVANAIESIEGEGAVRVTSQRAGGEAWVEIVDTGRGIPEDDLPQIFDPGFTTKGVKVGAGLGLAIAQRILSEHGGRIEARSVLGEGTTMRIALPLATAALAD